jgi:AraC family transcriptional regulator, regulatory protein of adaptative response / DNA-3-methyladenine glycosylase II
MELPDKATCHRALQSRDPRFDGLIYVGVKTTGIYCRPICPAKTAKYENCTFYSSAAAAQEAGYRPCLRCRPETAPEFASWRGTSNTVSRALALISEGALDGEGKSVDALAARLGIGERQLRRLFLQHLGASPIAVAQTRRVLFAKHLIHETKMPMTEIALAAGFSSLRRFNEVFHALFRRPPTALRRKSSASRRPNAEAGIALTVRYRPPYDWESMLSFLRARAIPGVEVVESDCYRRTVEIDGSIGTVSVSHRSKKNSLCVTIHFPNVQALPAILTRVRRVFDTGADIETIDAHLSNDSHLAPFVARRPGLRAPGGWDGFELAIRAILGQQVTVGAAKRLAGQLVALHGKPVPRSLENHPGLTYTFPTAKRLASVKSMGLGMPAARIKALRAMAEATVRDPNLFSPLETIEEAIARLRDIPGIGEWTAQYIALRAIRETDAFPTSDVGLLRGIAKVDGVPATPARLLQRAETWRPWRAYAAQHLWSADSADASNVA